MINMKRKYLIYSILFGFLCSTGILSAQAVYSDTVETEEKTKRAWELGIGVSVFQFSRVDFTNFTKLDNAYKMDLQLRHNVIGGNLYIARELNPYLYLDLQGTVGFTEQWIDGENKMKNLFMVGSGLQWRFGEYFGSKYI